MPICQVCFRGCKIEEGRRGFCGARTCKNGQIVAENYGKLTALALDPVEKKPLKMFYPGKKVLSIGSYGCNLRCPFCQNSEISWSKEAFEYRTKAQYYSPDVIVKNAISLLGVGNIGIAFTYNEPLIGYEFVRDTAKLSKDKGMKNILVTNGTATLDVLEEIVPYIDAMNIDLKSFSGNFYKNFLDGDFAMVKDFISNAVKHCHIELTTLIIPNKNDNEAEMRELSSWILGLEKRYNKKIPLHITRFFPRFHFLNENPTPVNTLTRLAEIAKENLEFVFLGNVP